MYAYMYGTGLAAWARHAQLTEEDGGQKRAATGNGPPAGSLRLAPWVRHWVRDVPEKVEVRLSRL